MSLCATTMSSPMFVESTRRFCFATPRMCIVPVRIATMPVDYKTPLKDEELPQHLAGGVLRVYLSGGIQRAGQMPTTVSPRLPVV